MEQECYHCGLEVPARSDFSLTVAGRVRRFCCTGCQAVASAIVEGGLESFYRFRTENSPKPQDEADSFAAYDLPEIQADFVHPLSEQELQAQLLLEGITCAACVWLIEHHLGKLPGVTAVRVNATTHRCLLSWDPRQQSLSALMKALAHIGYHPIPATEDRQQRLREQENRTALMRLGVAGLGMMQVGMVSIALYSGADAGWESYLRWISLLIATPVVLYSARPFYLATWRALRARHLVMDVPVSIAIVGAYLASCWATVFGGGEVYFDSVSMFTFFLLWGRYLEMRARHRNGIDSDRLAQLLPLTAERLVASGGSGAPQWQTVACKQLQLGDRVLVASGAVIPCDAVVVEGHSGVVETLLTGEPDAVDKQPGDAVIAGTLNTDSALQVEVTAIGQGTRLSAIERLVEQAQNDKPTQVAMADRVARYFVGAVLIVSTVVMWSWWQIAPEKAVWVTLSVLVVTCPCALALAAPTALTAAVARLRREGLLVTRGHVLEGLTRVQRVIFDKTGTLTLGRPQLAEVLSADGRSPEAGERSLWLACAAALETGSSHPIAHAFEPYAGERVAEGVRQLTGAGVEGEINGQCWRLGKPEFASPGAQPPSTPGQWLLLACEDRPRAWFRLADQLRDSARPLLDTLRARGIEVELVSGDAEPEVARVAAELGFTQWQAGCSPDQKLAYIQRLQEQGEPVLMVGDGINDVPVLSGAFVSVAMGGATDLAQTQADSVLLGNDLRVLVRGFDVARMTRRVIRQNLAASLTYNVLALPLASMGLIPPWAAAIGMSTSSLVVVANALRINRRRAAAGP